MQVRPLLAPPPSRGSGMHAAELDRLPTSGAAEHPRAGRWYRIAPARELGIGQTPENQEELFKVREKRTRKKP